MIRKTWPNLVELSSTSSTYIVRRVKKRIDTVFMHCFYLIFNKILLYVGHTISKVSLIISDKGIYRMLSHLNII